jgi:putative RecB family exonuclease
MEEKEKVWRSWSQLNEYNECGYRYYLKRIAKDSNGDQIWQRPAAWTVQGTAVHIAAEVWEKSDRILTDEEVTTIYTEAYWDQINERLEDTPNYSEWFASGPYRGFTDIDRRYKIGLDQIQSYLEFYRNDSPMDIPITINGSMAIEIPAEGLIGSVPVRGVIDGIMETDSGLRVRDIKTGKRLGDPMQLKIYQELIIQNFGIKIRFGDFWSGQTGVTTPVADLDALSLDDLTSEFQRLEEGINSERFDPKPSPACAMCDVQHACPFAASSNRT